MFVDVSIKYTQSEMKECQQLLAFLSKNPQIKADAEADEARLQRSQSLRPNRKKAACHGETRQVDGQQMCAARKRR